MKIVVTAVDSNGFDSKVDPRFGRAKYFALIDTRNNTIDFIKNKASNATSGAGVGAAQLIADQKADAVISGSFGPKAFKGLSVAGIKMFSFEGKVNEAIEACKNKELTEIKGPSNNGHQESR